MTNKIETPILHIYRDVLRMNLFRGLNRKSVESSPLEKFECTL